MLTILLNWETATGFSTSILIVAFSDGTEQSLSVEDKVLLAQAASERAAIVAKYDKVSAIAIISYLILLLTVL